MTKIKNFINKNFSKIEEKIQKSNSKILLDNPDSKINFININLSKTEFKNKNNFPESSFDNIKNFTHQKVNNNLEYKSCD